MDNEDKKQLADFMPKHSDNSSVGSYIAKAGAKKQSISRIVKLDDIIKVLESIEDPEIPVNIYELGLIYDIKILEKNDISIKMSLTAPGCPVAGEMPYNVALKVSRLNEVGEVEVKLVWDPPWTPEKMSEDARLALDYG